MVTIENASGTAHKQMLDAIVRVVNENGYSFAHGSGNIQEVRLPINRVSYASRHPKALLILEEETSSRRFIGIRTDKIRHCAIGQILFENASGDSAGSMRVVLFDANGSNPAGKLADTILSAIGHTYPTSVEHSTKKRFIYSTCISLRLSS